jgi:hypothetical protein
MFNLSYWSHEFATNTVCSPFLGIGDNFNQHNSDGINQRIDGADDPVASILASRIYD